jgi:hypothetical protein
VSCHSCRPSSLFSTTTAINKSVVTAEEKVPTYSSANFHIVSMHANSGCAADEATMPPGAHSVIRGDGAMAFVQMSVRVPSPTCILSGKVPLSLHWFYHPTIGLHRCPHADAFPLGKRLASVASCASYLQAASYSMVRCGGANGIVTNAARIRPNPVKCMSHGHWL